MKLSKLPIYLDYMATTPVDPRVTNKMMECLELSGNFGNASSRTHCYGERAEKAIEIARQQVAALVQANPTEIIWTSGATESNNLAIKGAALFYQRKGKHIVTMTTEHKSVLDTFQYLETKGFTVTRLSPQSSGILDLKQLEASFRDDTILVSIMHANNEIGVIQDIAAIGKLTRERGIIFHVDAAQSVGKIPIDLKHWQVDLMSFSAHKVYGPKGIGALYVRRQPRIRLEPLIHGGGHEMGLRSGTLPTHQIVGMGEAFSIARSEMIVENHRILKLRDRLWQGIQDIPEIYLNGDYYNRLPGNLNVSFGYVEGESLLKSLNDLAVSSGAACTSASIEPSYILRAIGRSIPLAHSSIRFCIGRFTTESEIDFAIQKIKIVISKLRDASPLWSQQIQETNKSDLMMGTGFKGTPERGDVVEIQIKIDQKNVIIDATFKAQASVTTVEICSWVTTVIINKPLLEVQKIDYQTIVKQLSLAPAKTHCAVIVLEALHAAIQSCLRQYQV